MSGSGADPCHFFPIVNGAARLDSSYVDQSHHFFSNHNAQDPACLPGLWNPSAIKIDTMQQFRSPVFSPSPPPALVGAAGAVHKSRTSMQQTPQSQPTPAPVLSIRSISITSERCSWMRHVAGTSRKASAASPAGGGRVTAHALYSSPSKSPFANY